MVLHPTNPATIGLLREREEGELQSSIAFNFQTGSSKTKGARGMDRNRNSKVQSVMESTAEDRVPLDDYVVSQPRWAGAALRRGEERFRKIFDCSNDAIFIIDPDRDVILEANPRACHMLEYSREELLSLSISAVHPTEMPKLLAFSQSVFERGNGWTDELTCLTRTGETLPAEISASVIEFDAKHCIVAMVRDTSERKRAERSLQESERRYRDLYEEAPNAYFSVDRDGRVQSANGRAKELFGDALDQLTGRPVLEQGADTPAGKAKIQNSLSRLLTGQELCGEEIEIRGTGDRCAWISLSGRPVLDETGVMQSRLIAVDITERKQVEQALRESEQRFRCLVEHAADAFFVIDDKGRLVDVNNRACESLGYTRLELLSRDLRDIQVGVPFEKIEEAWKQMLPEGPFTLEGIHQRKDGTTLPVEVRVGLIELGGSEYKFALARDITERKRAELALRESEERLARILESAMDAIVTVSAGRRIILFNAAAETVFRCPARTALEQPLDRFLSEPFRDLLEDSLRSLGRKCLTRKYAWVPAGLTARRFDGEEFPVEATLSQVEVAGERLLTIILRDINERQRAELELQKLQGEKVQLQEVLKSESELSEVVGASAVIRKVFRSVEQVAPTDSTVLITGETGTGKELIARAIHNLSSRKHSVLVRVNCAALPPGLIESELFGHEKGAFTGAVCRKLGRFELARQGTIFLDEIGELPLELQAKLLRVLQEGEFERVGGSQSLKADARVIAATNRRLEEATHEGKFRVDLYYRLNVFPIHVPPLRERIGDIQLLTEYFISKYARKMGKKIETVPRATLDDLAAYSWPGNVRELENVIERAVIISQGPELDLGEWFPARAPSPNAPPFETLEEHERQHILSALDRTGWQVSGKRGAATLLEMKPTTLEARMKKLGIHRQ